MSTNTGYTFDTTFNANAFRLFSIQQRLGECSVLTDSEIAAMVGLRLGDVPHYVRELKAQESHLAKLVAETEGSAVA